VRHTRWAVAFIVLAFSGACKPAEQSRVDTAIIRDDFGNPVKVDAPFTRIVSLNPTSTEILFAIGAGSRLVGRSHWDSWPDSAKYVTDVGNGMGPNVEAVLQTHPDLVILYASNDNRAAAARIHGAGIQTLAVRTDSIAQFRRLTLSLGRLLGNSIRARAVVESVDATLNRVKQSTSNQRPVSVFYHTWDSPLITIGGRSFLHELVVIAGGKNVYGDIDQISPVVTLEDVVKRNPDVILVGPAAAKTILASPQWQAVPAVRAKRVFVYDTNVVGRPSVTLGMAAVNIAKLLHPGLIK
jgi:iron complex transport system substrate-binding protein